MTNCDKYNQGAYSIAKLSQRVINIRLTVGKLYTQDRILITHNPILYNVSVEQNVIVSTVHFVCIQNRWPLSLQNNKQLRLVTRTNEYENEFASHAMHT